MSLVRAVPAGRDAGRHLLAADVGGTHVRIGLVRAGGDPAQPVEVLAYRKLACADYPGLDEAVADFLSEAAGDAAAETAVIAAAGHQLDDGRLISANLPWPVDPARLRERLGLRELRLVNDFQALAHAVPWFEASRKLHLCGPAQPAGGPVLALGPGTGFGCAVWVPAPGGPVVLATEAGQASLAVGTEPEIAVLRELLRSRSHVAVEHVLSGPGLLNLYQALCALHGDAPSCANPREVTDAATSGRDAQALEALSMFCALLGSTAADLALACGAQGGVYLAGGLLPGVGEFLAGSRFVERFLGKGLMREALERIPVTLVEHGRLGVLGAVAWYLNQHPQTQNRQHNATAASTERW